MSGVYSVVPAAMAAHAAIHHTAGETVVSAASADHAAHLAAAAAALGPIGHAIYIPPYAQAQVNCLTAGLQVGQVYHGIGHATSAHAAAAVAADNT